MIKHGRKSTRVDLPGGSVPESFPGLKRVAGVDVSFFADGTYAIATVVVLSFPEQLGSRKDFFVSKRPLLAKVIQSREIS